MIVNMLVDLDGKSFETADEVEILKQANVTLSNQRGADPHEQGWIAKTFRGTWADEAKYGWNWFAKDIAGHPVGFATYEQRHFKWWWLEEWLSKPEVGIFGPMGVHRSLRRRGMGAILLCRALASIQAMGFRQALIPAVGPVTFYERWAGARVVERLPKRLL